MASPETESVTQAEKQIEEPIDYSRKWYVMLAVAMGIFLATIDGSIVNVALPTLEAAFDTSFAAVQWVVLGYLLTVTTLMLSMGRWADMIGKKPVYMVGFAIFTAGSVLCAFSPTVYVLVAFRILQAIGASMIMALGIAIVTESFPSEERGRALGIAGSIVSVGIVAGPTIGGLLIEALSWHWIFLVNLPVGVVGLFVAQRHMPFIRPKGGQRFDYWGAATLCICLICFLLAMTLGQSLGFGSIQVWLLFAGSVLALAIFLRIEWRMNSPMIDLKLFRHTQFSTNLGTGFLVFVSLGGMVILLPFYLQGVLGYSVRAVGLLMAVVPVALGIMAPISGMLSDRFGSRPITVIGLAIIVFGFLSAGTMSTTTGILDYIVRFLPIGIGLGTFQSPNNSAVMGAAPRERLGVASGLLSITRTMGQTTGISIMGTFWASRVAVYGGIEQAAQATQADAEFQVAALNNTFMLMAGLAGVALAFAVRAWYVERRERQSEQQAMTSAAD